MSPPEQAIKAVNALVTMPTWSPREVAATLQLRLERFKQAPSSTKQFVGRGNGLFERVRLLMQTFGGSAKPAIYIGCNWGAQVTRADLGALIPSRAVPTILPPAIGSKGPPRVSSIFQVDFAGTRVGFGVESRDGSVPFLHTLSFERPLVALDPADFDESCFQAYQVSEAEHVYAIERRSSHHDAVLVRSLTQSDRVVHVSFSTVEAFITEPFAIKLMDRLLLHGLLKNELFGKYDTAEYLAEELESTTRVPASSP
jgi:hypothetical protein